MPFFFLFLSLFPDDYISFHATNHWYGNDYTADDEIYISKCNNFSNAGIYMSSPIPWSKGEPKAQFKTIDDTAWTNYVILGSIGLVIVLDLGNRDGGALIFLLLLIVFYIFYYQTTHQSLPSIYNHQK